jgi:hypothetical protein
MKHFSLYALTLVLVAGTSAALAGGRDHRGHREGHHYSHRGPHHYARPNFHRRYYDNRYRAGFYYPSYIGAALLGSAFGASLYHNHNGAPCYDNHSSDQYQQRSSGYSEVVGCHRIEQLEDGTQRRVEIPMSQCR